MIPSSSNVTIIQHLNRDSFYQRKKHLLLYIRGLCFLAVFGSFFLLFLDEEYPFYLSFKKYQPLNESISDYGRYNLSKSFY